MEEKKMKRVNIPEDVMTKLERLHFEYNAMQSNMAFIIEQHKDDPSFLDSSIFVAYTNKLTNKLIEYQKQKDCVTALLPEDLKKPENAWMADFENRVILVQEG